MRLSLPPAPRWKSSLRLLSLFFLSAPKCSSTFRMQLSFPFPLLARLPSGVFYLDASCHFQPNCLMGTFTRPKTTSVSGSTLLPVIKAPSMSLPSTHIPSHHPVLYTQPSSSPCCHSASPLAALALVWNRRDVFLLWGMKQLACKAFLHCFVWCLCVYLSSCQY